MTPRAERTQKMTEIFKKVKKICNISIKLRVLSDRLFVSSNDAGGGGGEGGGGQQWGGGNSAVGWGWGQ